VRAWKAERQREQQTSGRGTFVPLVFAAGEAFQLDWSEDWAIIGGDLIPSNWSIFCEKNLG
jgi:hypothetical protein